MTMTLAFYDGVHEDLDLIDAGGTDYYAHADGTLTFPANEVVEMQTGEDGRTVIYRRYDGVREFVVPVSLGGSRDTALNNAQAIHRWLQQAARAEDDGTGAYPVYLKVQEEGATNATVHRIMAGVLDEGRAHLNWRQIQSAAKYKIYKARLHLRAYPTGTTVEPIKMDNVLLGSPDMNRFVGTNQIQGWTVINGAEVRTVQKDRSLIGPYCMKLTTASATHGIRSDYGLVPPYWTAASLIHIIVDSGTWSIQLEAPSGVIKQATGITTATQESLSIASGGGPVERSAAPSVTWYSFALTMAENEVVADTQMRLNIICTAAGTIWIDGAQIRTIKPFNEIVRPEMDVANVDGPVDGWLLDENSLTVAGLDASNYSNAPKAVVVTFDAGQSDESAHIKTLLHFPNTVNKIFSAIAEVRFDTDDGATVMLELRDGADNVLDSIEFDESTIAGLAEYSRTGDDTATWYGLKVSGTNALEPGAYLIFYPSSVASTTGISFYLDQVILTPDPNPNPGEGIPFTQAYISGGNSLYNRNDYDRPTDSPAGTRQYYFDHFRLFNIPGNRPALVNLKMRLISGSEVARTFLISRFTEEKNKAARHNLEPENFGTGAGSWADISDNNYSNGSYKRFTSAGAEGYITIPIDKDSTLSWVGERLIFATVEANKVANSYTRFALDQDWGETVIANGERGTFTAINTLELHYLGPLNLYYSDAATNYARTRNILRVYAYADNGQTIEIDEVIALPNEDGGWMSFYFPQLYQLENIIVDSVRGEVIRGSEGKPAISRGSKRLTCLPGPISTLFSIRWFDASDNSYVVGQYVSLDVEVWPQTTTLLGTK